MRYFPQRARRNLDLATLLKICPQCLGDLVSRSDFSGEYYHCLQCNVRTEPRTRIGHLPDLPAQPDAVRPLAPGAFEGGDAPREALAG